MGCLCTFVLTFTFVVCRTTLALPDGLTGFKPPVMYGTDDDDKPVKDDVFLPRQPKAALTRTWPGMINFPDATAFNILGSKLDGKIVTPIDANFSSLALMRNIRVTKLPYVIVLVASDQDVVETMLFAKKYNLMVTIQSSGHSYIGRSTFDGSIQINFKGMTKRTVNLNSSRNPAGEITVESGNSWMDVYTEVSKIQTVENNKTVGRVIVGGSAHTVAMGGYTQGGGHSPMTRTLGLAVDNLLEATLVTVDGRILTVSEMGTSAIELDGSVTRTNDTSLFWAIRGGGGGTWGAVLTFTFKLHYAPERFRNVQAQWILKAGTVDSFGRETLKFVLREVAKLCPNWGGYFMLSGDSIPNTIYSEVLTVFFNHFGSDSDPCNKDIDALLNFNVSGNQVTRKDISYPTFLGYEKTAIDAAYSNTYIVNTFVQPSTITDEKKLDELVDIFIHLDLTRGGCTGALIGGAASKVQPETTPVNPYFRSGLMSLSCGVSWDSSKVLNGSAYIDMSRRLGLSLRKVATGVYFNECDEDLTDWKTMFWGSMTNYCKLKAIKQRVDPDHFLWCHNCVGSDFQTDDCTHGLTMPIIG
ncbi:uncharacterized FAD-linked oxidoreductase ARB_02478 [Aplysia californica]|uniref:Uncharacterized FAD-linked oxidoreductase ARB_02478 n=1 Tax=Aplysia californica TaxID=6500 RepID=A0ABM1ACT7_APLCA|nr:uncharacterized FAD-linked oxidoreductase ARB_02478 [Aplysia californica]